MIERVSVEPTYLAEEISRKSCESSNCFLLVDYYKIEEWDKLKTNHLILKQNLEEIKKQESLD